MPMEAYFSDIFFEPRCHSLYSHWFWFTNPVHGIEFFIILANNRTGEHCMLLSSIFLTHYNVHTQYIRYRPNYLRIPNKVCIRQIKQNNRYGNRLNQVLNKEFKDFYANICTLRFLNSTNLLRRIFPTTCSRFANSTTRQQVVRQILVT